MGWLRRWRWLVAGVVALAALALWARYMRGWLLDDAYITFRYADNFAAGLGPVFNPGEHVEGYTSFLWMAMLAGARGLGVPPATSSIVLGLACAAGVVVLMLRARRYLPTLPPSAPAVATVFLVTCSVFGVWPASGMEVTLFTLLLLWAVLLHCAGRSGQPTAAADLGEGALLGLLCLARPEGYMVSALLLLDGLWRRRLSVWRLALPCLAIAGGHEAWRLAYYGYPVPNTFYAKVGWTPAQVHRGAKYAWHFFMVNFPVTLPAVLFLLTPWWRKKPAAALPLVVVTAVYTAYIAVVGGDYLFSFRFFAPLMPLVCLAAAWGAFHWLPERRWLAVVAALIVVGNISRVWPIMSPYLSARDRVARNGEIVGAWLREHARPGSLLAVNATGAVPYFSKLRVIDGLGLNDAHIAHRRLPDMGSNFAGHEKGDGAYVLSRKPDYIIFGYTLGTVNPVFRGDREIDASPIFRRDYRLRAFTVPELENTMIIYERKDKPPLTLKRAAPSE